MRIVIDSGSEALVARISDLPDLSGFELLTYVGEGPHRLNELAADADAAYVYQHELSGAAIRSAPRLKFIQKHGLNCKNIDVGAATERGITVATVPLFRNVAVAEHAMALLLACAHKILAGHRAVEGAVYRDMGLQPVRTSQREIRSNWANIAGVVELMGAAVGIVGLGDIGMEIARRCRAFGMEVFYHQRTPHSRDVEEAYGARYLALDDLLGTIDYLILILPHTPQTEGMIGPAQLARMKPTATLINVARGAVVDEDALADALARGVIAMAGLDVFRDEPLPASSPLLGMPNVVLTPHLGGGSYRSREADHRAGIENILRFFRGEPPHGAVNAV
jgi:gluconate 2-dehydrogenase